MHESALELRQLLHQLQSLPCLPAADCRKGAPAYVGAPGSAPASLRLLPQPLLACTTHLYLRLHAIL